MKIMIIDDDADILNLFKDFLSKRGYALIITDIRMPGISGIELIKRVCEINSDIKIMIMSAFDINGDDLKEIRVEEQVQKPIHMRTLAQSIEKILKN
jgi:two-component SAPR family response regulator